MTPAVADATPPAYLQVLEALLAAGQALCQDPDRGGSTATWSP